jgi:altronate hydrolase
METTLQILRIHPQDNVAVALRDLSAGECLQVDGSELRLAETVGRGHKVALHPIACGESVIKYGHPIGHASAEIAAGAWVHVHNLKTNLSGVESYTYEPEFAELAADKSERTFQGFARADGEVGIRNELWIIPTVGCVNKTAENLARECAGRALPESVDGVYAFPHPYGCSQLGQDHENTRQMLAGLVRHPNAGGVLVLGLGCENNTMESFKELLGDVAPARVRFLVCQEVEDEMSMGLDLLNELAAHAGQSRRQAVPLAKLRVGLKCGGSDGFSGITANPLVGAFSDKLIAAGGTSVLSEVPEMFGAERLLMNRCRNRQVFDKCVRMVNGFKEYFQRYDQVVYENPSPGNKAGGISTLEDKSLGCTQKGGLSPVVDVLDYGEPIRRNGLNLLTGPGNDMVAVTVLAAAGAHLVLFTTGRGTPLGGPVPTLKIATNTPLARQKKHWIDFNAGQLLEGVPMETLCGQLLEQVVATASGQCQTRNEEHGFREIALLKDGVTL